MPRLTVPLGDIPVELAAKRMGLTLAQFELVKYRLFDRGFPQPDPDTGNYDLDAIDAWRKLRNPQVYTGGLPPPLPGEPKPRDARESLKGRLRR